MRIDSMNRGNCEPLGRGPASLDDLFAYSVDRVLDGIRSQVADASTGRVDP